MKQFLGVFGFLILLFVAVQFYVAKSRSDVEKYPNTVLKTYSEFEIRKYDSSLFVSLNMEKEDYKKMSEKGFTVLSRYFFGKNKSKQKIAMTSPVVMTMDSQTDIEVMMFMIPKAINKADLPEPKNESLQFVREPSKKVAVISFGGWVNASKLKKYQNELVSSLETEGIEFTNNFYVLGYNPPYDILFRKNEIMVELR